MGSGFAHQFILRVEIIDMSCFSVAHYEILC